MKTETPIHEAVMEIMKNSPLASEREEKLRELLNIKIYENAEQLTDADKIAEALAVRLGLDTTPPEEDNVHTLYPSMKNEETPVDEPLEGFDEGLKTFAKSFYSSLKGDSK